ncbi:MAG TPA: DUF3738 domain-containing protein [Bryobacteraceae bacterium]|jgi:hypothetical protein
MSFEAASVKPSQTPKPPSFPLDNGDAKTPGGRFTAGLRLPVYIAFAYKLRPGSYGSMLGEVDRPVVDGTGLSGAFDYTVEWEGRFPGPRPGAPRPDASPPDPQGTIDHVERPLEN